MNYRIFMIIKRLIYRPETTEPVAMKILESRLCQKYPDGSHLTGPKEILSLGKKTIKRHSADGDIIDDPNRTALISRSFFKLIEPFQVFWELVRLASWPTVHVAR